MGVVGWNKPVGNRVRPMDAENEGVEMGSLEAPHNPVDRIPTSPNPSPALFLKTKLEQMLHNNYFTTTMTVFTIYALFGDDIKLMSYPHDPSVDVVFMGLSSTAFFLFILELVSSCYAKEGYCPWPQIEWTQRKLLFGLHPLPFVRIGSFYFYLDIVATASLIFELPWILVFPNDPTEVVLGESGATAGGGAGSGDASALQSARAGRASRAGARAGRIVRIVRMVRLVRLVRLLKVKEEVQDEANHQQDAEQHTESNEEDELEELLPESHVGKTLSDLTTRRVIVGVLLMLILLPLITYTPSDDTFMNASRLAHEFYVHNDICKSEYGGCASNYSVGLEVANELLKRKSETPSSKMLLLEFTYKDDGVSGSHVETWYENAQGLENVRYDAKQKFIVSSFAEFNNSNMELITRTYATHVVIDKAYAKQEESVNSFILTWFVILLLGVGTMVFAADTERLVISPIEHMMKRVTEISNDPLSTGNAVKTQADQEGMETTFLLQTIDKIGNLMRIGFGEAGAEIIAANLRDSSDDKLNVAAILRGRPIHSIFGFCDIRNFTDTTECLQEEVMTFVNKVAHILHNIVKDCNGAANKNIGDAFLLSWKLPEAYETQHCDLFDKALYAFLKFTVLLRRYDNFVTEFSAASSHRLYQRMPDYRCAMGMGLHVGEAVEGAIGTPQKIDATYISLHVNNSEFLESSTKAYKVPLLMSHFFYDHLSPEAKSKCRMVDVVKVTDQLTFQLWTYDIDYDSDYSSAAALSPVKKKVQSPRGRVTKTDIKPVLPGQKNPTSPREGNAAVPGRKEPVPEIKTWSYGATKYSTSLWNSDPDLKRLRHKMDSPDLMSSWATAIEFYVKGNWPAAISEFEGFQVAFDELNGCRDGAADFLLGFMKGHPGHQAPENWDGSHG